MVNNQDIAYKIRDTFVSPTTGELMYSVDGTIYPYLTSRSYETKQNFVVVKGVHIGGREWPFTSVELNADLQANRRRWRRSLKGQLRVSALIRMVPSTDEHWSGEVMPEVVALRVGSSHNRYVSDSCEGAARLVLI
jgi:hypothetical protein